MAGRNPRYQSVKYGTPIVGTISPANKVDTYMRSGVGQLLGPGPNSDMTQEINNDLLQIITKGINDIVDELKLRLGSNFTESNENAGIIKKRLDDLKAQIDNDLIDIGRNDIETITLDTQANQYEPIVGDDINVGDFNDIYERNPYEFINLKSPHQNVIDGQENYYGINIGEVDLDDAGIELVTNRLKNCQNLEFLYLKKHDEIMKIFAFTMNLFDKYKYAIKVILFLLKHLVYKDPAGPPGEPPKINVPLEIIPNIKKLLIDQKLVQGVINKMKTVIVDNANPGSQEEKLQRATSDKPDMNTPHVEEALINSKIPGPIPAPPPGGLGA